MVMKCLEHGYRVIEIPAHEYRRKGGVSKINVFRLSHVYLWNLLCGLAVKKKGNPEHPLR